MWNNDRFVKLGDLLGGPVERVWKRQTNAKNKVGPPLDITGQEAPTQFWAPGASSTLETCKALLSLQGVTASFMVSVFAPPVAEGAATSAAELRPSGVAFYLEKSMKFVEKVSVAEFPVAEAQSIGSRIFYQPKKKVFLPAKKKFFFGW